MPYSPPRVFISYSHDSPEHKDRVLELCDRLRTDGIDAWIDQYEISPPEGWPRWCAARVREAEFVLVVCSEVYERRFRGAEEPGTGLGGVWEGYAVTQELYKAGSRNTKFIPVLLPGENPGHIPDVLCGATYYKLGEDKGYWGLYRHLTGQPGIVAPPVGLRVTLAKQERKTDRFFCPPESRYEDDLVKELSEALEAAYRQLEDEATSGQDTTHIREEILRIRREMRDGPRLQAGEFLSDGRFRLIDVLGRGGFATVWKAYDRKRHELVAVKVLHGQHAEDRSRRERFFRGARKMAELQHPGIVRIIEAHLEDSGHHYFVMEYVEGGDLCHAVLAGRLAPETILSMILEIGESLAFAHEKGIIHRDVKPENILLDGERPKLTDFDLVRALDTTGGTQTQGQLGTFLYTAPEVLANAKDIGVGADVYSLAMTAVFAFHGKNLATEVWRHPEVFVEGLPCSAAIRGTLRRSISWEVGERPGSIRDFCKKLRRDAEQIPLPPVSENMPKARTSSDRAENVLSRDMKGPDIPPLLLIVDDVEDGREITAEYLEYRGFRAVTAADGLEALEKAFELIPDVIIMDLSMPRLDGWEAIRRLRQDSRTRQIPVIALTVHGLEGRTRAWEAGCDAIVAKPCLPRDLEAEIRRQLRGGHATEEAVLAGTAESQPASAEVWPEPPEVVASATLVQEQPSKNLRVQWGMPAWIGLLTLLGISAFLLNHYFPLIEPRAQRTPALDTPVVEPQTQQTPALDTSVVGQALVRIGGWNIENLGNRTDSPQQPRALAEYIFHSGVDVLALAEINDTDGKPATRTNSLLDDAFRHLNGRQGHDWLYELFPNRNPADERRLCGIAWNKERVSRAGESFRIPMTSENSSADFWTRHPRAVKFSTETGQTDFVVVPLHMKSNAGGATRAQGHREAEALALVGGLDSVRTHFTDSDIILIGDTNCLNAGEAALRAYRKAGFRDLNDSDISTYLNDNYASPFDRILVPSTQNEFRFSRQMILRLKDSDLHRRNLSDHYLVWADFRKETDDDGPLLPSRELR